MRETAIILEIVKEAGKIILDNQHENFDVISKGNIDYVTEIDKKVNDFVCYKLMEAFPQDDILSEESKNKCHKRDRRWIIDPIDGTTNFIKGYPFVAISVAYEISQELVLGVVYNPIMNELFVAEKGYGATRDGKAISAGRTQDLSKSVLASGFPYDMWETEDDNIDQWKKFMKSCISCRCDGSAALDICKVACGQFDGYWEKGIYAWDMAAGIVIAREANCMVTDYKGQNNCLTRGEIVVANPTIHQHMLQKINE